MINIYTQPLLGEVETGNWLVLRCMGVLWLFNILTFPNSVMWVAHSFSPYFSLSDANIFVQCRDKLKEVVTSDLRKLLGAEGQPVFVK